MATMSSDELVLNGHRYRRHHRGGWDWWDGEHWQPAGAAGMWLDEIEQLRARVDELAGALVDAEQATPIDLGDGTWLRRVRPSSHTEMVGTFPWDVPRRLWVDP